MQTQLNSVSIWVATLPSVSADRRLPMEGAKRVIRNAKEARRLKACEASQHTPKRIQMGEVKAEDFRPSWFLGIPHGVMVGGHFVFEEHHFVSEKYVYGRSDVVKGYLLRRPVWDDKRGEAISAKGPIVGFYDSYSDAVKGAQKVLKDLR